MRSATSLPLAVYANVGIPGHEGATSLVCDVDPSAYGRFAEEWLDEGASIVGGCCGTTPQHIRMLHAALAGRREGDARPVIPAR
jgi:methionine synthase I (cobalamin-dependent)